MKAKKPSTFAKMEKMSDAALAKYFDKRVPLYRKALARLTSFLKKLFGRVMKGHLATAADVIVNVSGGEHSESETSNALTVQKFEHPGPRKLEGYIDALEQIDFINELDYQISRGATTENKTLKAQQQLRVDLYNGLVDAYTEAVEAMRDISNKHLPDAVGNVFKAAKKYFDPREAEFVANFEAANPGSEPDHVLDYYINVGVKDHTVDFVLNADVSHWERETTGGVMVGVVTCRLEPKEDAFTLRVFANVLDKVALPGRYNIGTELKGADISAIAKKMPKVFDMEFAGHNLITFMAPVQLKLDETEITERLMKIEGVNGVVVNDDNVTIEMGEKDRDAHAQVMRALDGIPFIKDLLRKGYTKALRSLGDDTFTYSLTIKT